MSWRSTFRRTVIGVPLTFFQLSGELAAQTEDLPPPPSGYKSAVPDLSDKALDQTKVNTTWFTLRFGFAPIIDYSIFSQDQASLDQVGEQQNTFQVRSGRIQLRGDLFHSNAHPWRYLFSIEYRGLDNDPTSTWNITDVALTIPVGPLGSLQMGKVKEPFVYEMVGDAANLGQVERLLSPFFVSRNVGFRLSNTMLHERGTWSVGVFNDWILSDIPLSSNGTSISARMTSVPVWGDSGRKFLHLGLAYRYQGADRDSLRLRGRPESNVTDYFVDTEKFPGDYLQTLGLELLASSGPWSVLAEFSQAWTKAPERSNPSFNGWYVLGSWVVTGENRPYDRKAGYARRVMPRGHWGAVELVARVGRVDLADAGISGGELVKWYGGINWWANRRWRASGGYGNASLDRFDLEGTLKQYFFRLQWIY